MRTLLSPWRVLMLLFVISLSSMATAQTVDNIASGFATGNITIVKKYLNNNVELVIQHEDNIYSKEQLSVVLDDFFKKNSPSRFTIAHQGTRDNAQFVIGNLDTKKGTYRIYILIKHNLIHQLRIENPND